MIGHQVKTTAAAAVATEERAVNVAAELGDGVGIGLELPSVVGGLLGSRPAWVNSFLLYIQTDRSITNGRPYSLPFQVEP